MGLDTPFKGVQVVQAVVRGTHGMVTKIDEKTGFVGVLIDHQGDYFQ